MMLRGQDFRHIIHSASKGAAAPLDLLLTQQNVEVDSDLRNWKHPQPPPTRCDEWRFLSWGMSMWPPMLVIKMNIQTFCIGPTWSYVELNYELNYGIPLNQLNIMGPAQHICSLISLISFTTHSIRSAASLWVIWGRFVSNRSSGGLGPKGDPQVERTQRSLVELSRVGCRLKRQGIGASFSFAVAQVDMLGTVVVLVKSQCIHW